jgi:hypothetical protein
VYSAVYYRAAGVCSKQKSVTEQMPGDKSDTEEYIGLPRGSAAIDPTNFFLRAPMTKIRLLDFFTLAIRLMGFAWIGITLLQGLAVGLMGSMMGGGTDGWGGLSVMALAPNIIMGAVMVMSARLVVGISAWDVEQEVEDGENEA